MPEKVFDGSKDAALGSENILNRPISKYVSYDQGKHEIYSTILLPMTQNFLQASYDWAWQLEEQIDAALIPYIDSVVLYSSDKDGNLSDQDRKQFELAVDSERNVVTTTQNKQLTWGEDDADITGATDPRFAEVRKNWDDILYGTSVSPVPSRSSTSSRTGHWKVSRKQPADTSILLAGLTPTSSIRETVARP